MPESYQGAIEPDSLKRCLVGSSSSPSALMYAARLLVVCQCHGAARLRGLSYERRRVFSIIVWIIIIIVVLAILGFFGRGRF
jgi:hypothetical protein